jgi:hypothetical protein
MQPPAPFQLPYNIDVIIVDALVVVNSIPIIYSGYVDHYIMNKDGGLDRIILKYPVRRTYQSIRHENFEDHVIPGDFIIIPYSKIENLNFTYLKIRELSLKNEIL